MRTSNDVQQGVVTVTNVFHNHAMFGVSHEFQSSYKVWFTGNASIVEAVSLNFNTDTAGYTTVKTDLLSYVYINPAIPMYTEYNRFDEKGQLMKRANVIDSVGGRGVWNFYDTSPVQYNSITALSDTTINGVDFGRWRMKKDANNSSSDLVLYTRCDKKGVPVQYMRALSDSLGCPILRTDSYERGKLAITSTIDFVSDSLSSKEIKLFEQWGSKN